MSTSICRLTTKLSGADGSPRKAARAYPRPLQRLVRGRVKHGELGAPYAALQAAGADL